MTHTRAAFVKSNWQADVAGVSRHGRVHKPPLEALASGTRCAALAT
jgi:predicted secreted Zn-dependent protease